MAMQKRWTAFALSALLALGLTGCASGSNAEWDSGHSVLPDDTRSGGNSGVYSDRDFNGKSDRFAADRRRFETMLENGRVRDRDGDLRNDW